MIFGIHKLEFWNLLEGYVGGCNIDYFEMDVAIVLEIFLKFED